MSIKIIEGNLFDSKAKIIAHQVNCQGKMNSGVAKEVRQRYPHVYRDYALLCESLSDHTEKLLGTMQLIHMDENETHSKYLPYQGRYIANLYAQNRYGYDGAQYTNIKLSLPALNVLHRSHVISTAQLPCPTRSAVCAVVPTGMKSIP